MVRLHLFLVCLCVWIYCWSGLVKADPCLCYQEVDTGLKNNPTIFASMPPPEREKVVVGQQDGIAYLYNKNWVQKTKPFLNLSGKIKLVIRGGNENGLRGMTFHPSFGKNRKLYVYYTKDPETPGMDSTAVISEFRTNKKKTKVNVKTERVILKVDQPTSVHNGGALLFGCDGYLYIFFGDGGGQNDPRGDGQNKNTLLTSVLRLDVSNGSVPYKIPADNPFVNEPNSRPEIFAHGFRNPWRADIDEGDWLTGYGKCRIFTSDVGQSKWEEINHVKRGGNYGWRAKEGKQCNSQYPAECADLVGDTDPIHDYPHSWGRAVAGGHVYRGCRHPAFNGMYIFGDFSSARLARLKETGKNTDVWEAQELFPCPSDKCPEGTSNQRGSLNLGFGEDYDGELYMMTTEESLLGDDSGKVYKIVVPDRLHKSKKHFDSCLSVASPKLWNSLPLGARLANSQTTEITLDLTFPPDQ